MSVVVTVLHVFVCIFLVAVVLLQQGKGAQVGAVFGGGGGATMFGGRGAGNFLTKLTAAAAAIYMLTSLSLSYLGMSAGGERLFEDGVVEQEAPKPEAPFENLGDVPVPEAGKAQPGEAAQGGPAKGADAP